MWTVAGMSNRAAGEGWDNEIFFESFISIGHGIVMVSLLDEPPCLQYTLHRKPIISDKSSIEKKKTI